MSRCFTWFPFGGLGEPNIYHNLGEFTRKRGIYLEDCLTCEELVGGHSQEKMGEGDYWE